MPARKNVTTEQDEQIDPKKTEPIQVKGLPIPDVPKRIIANALKDRIERGVYEPGEELPSLTKLETMTGVARGTIRAALGILAEQGYLKSVIGMGTFILPREYWPGGDKHGTLGS